MPDSAPPDRTLRWFAESRYAYAVAVKGLAEYARSHGDEFEVSPASVTAMEHQGLAVSGPDLAGVTSLLDGIEGLTREPPSG
jgi:hypothetical protein